MWDWINCHLAGRHEFVVSSNANKVCLRCLRCGQRSSGWQVVPGDNGRSYSGAGDSVTKGGHGLLAGALALLGLLLAHR